MGIVRFPRLRVAVHRHHDNCILLLVDEEMHRKERVNTEMEAMQRKDKTGEDREEKIKAELRKQGLIVDDVDSVKVDAIEQNPKPKYYGMDTLPAV